MGSTLFLYAKCRIFKCGIFLLHQNVQHFSVCNLYIEGLVSYYNEMLRRIEPEKIICYNIPFPEMQGDIVFVDYERSSWKYMSYERSFQKEDLEAFKIVGAPNLNCDTIKACLESA